MPLAIIILLLAVVTAIVSMCDREIGDGKKGLMKRTLAVAVAIFGAGSLTYLALGSHNPAPGALAWLVTGAAWAAFRSITFKRGAGAPHNAAERKRAVRRQLYILPLAIIPYWSGGPRDCLILGLCLLGSAVVNSLMRFDYGEKDLEAREGGYELDPELNVNLERMSGATFGLALIAFAIARAVAGS